MKSETTEKHRKETSRIINCGIIILSDTISKSQNKDDDKSGQYILEKLSDNKYDVVDYKIISDDKDTLKSTIDDMINKDIDVIFTSGGTGISSRDITIETVTLLFEKELVGFGEIFRLKTYEELGSPAILTRATSGIYKNTLIFCMPGSPNAVKLGLSLVIDELPHLTKHLKE
ncbi:MAG: MogA/MoaB family molybdenum cofactor biosynthesis protein [Methanobrevibacter sp.]|jgi:molybdenum cofactor biosynthesis protein B|nr:MogA/MoaB family molybdenum cofactor biosynthesis protein [Candidatus Methanovirga meridionalis]